MKILRLVVETGGGVDALSNSSRKVRDGDIDMVFVLFLLVFVV